MSELLGASTNLLDDGAEMLGAGSRRVQDLATLAQQAMAELRTSWSGSDLTNLTEQGEQVSQLLAGISAALADCGAQLRTQSAAQRLTSAGDRSSDRSSDQAGPVDWTAPTPAPPRTWSPDVSAHWWRSLSSLQQQGVIRDHPEWIGNRDGIGFAARDLANRALLAAGRERLLAERENLLAAGEHHAVALAGARPGAVLGSPDPAVDQVEARLAALAAVDKTLALPGDRQLLLLDLSTPLAEAAIASGDVDSADNVAVLVSGFSSSVSASMVSGDQNMGDLRRLSEAESRRAHADQSTAAVMWLGYQAPQLGWHLLGDDTLTNDRAARSGAARLVPFLRGIGAARDEAAHLTLLGHSYGSLTAGLALQQDTGVDDAVFFGSPGLGTSHLEDLRLAPGHAYYIEARQDPVGDLGLPHGPFGIDPSHLPGIEHASAEESAVVDASTGQIRHLDAVTGHSSYLADHSTSQYNVSVVVAGLPARRVRDDGEGFGDLLSWPVPGTY